MMNRTNKSCIKKTWTWKYQFTNSIICCRLMLELGLLQHQRKEQSLYSSEYFKILSFKNLTDYIIKMGRSGYIIQQKTCSHQWYKINWIKYNEHVFYGWMDRLQKWLGMVRNSIKFYYQVRSMLQESAEASLVRLWPKL